MENVGQSFFGDMNSMQFKICGNKLHSFWCIVVVYGQWGRLGATLVQNCGDSEIGKVVIQLAKERKLQTLSIIDDKPGNPDTIEELKALGADIVVPESYTKTW